jgi:hypothetical protein
VDASGREDPRLTILEGELREVGVQGVWPIGEAGKRILAMRPEAEAQLYTLSLSSDSENIVAPTAEAFYRQWVRNNGRIAGQIRPCELFHLVGKSMMARAGSTR